MIEGVKYDQPNKSPISMSYSYSLGGGGGASFFSSFLGSSFLASGLVSTLAGAELTAESTSLTLNLNDKFFTLIQERKQQRF
jgi:hypothetical protein